jgi:hypothetical protein
MVHSFDGIRLIVELICGVALVLLIGGVALYAAFMVGWPMALGMTIVFILEFIHKTKHNS